MNAKNISWRILSIILVVLLVVMVLLSILGIYQTPQKVTLFIFGTLVAIGIGYTILSPRTPLGFLDPEAKNKFRKQQLIVGLVFSLLFGLMFLIKEIRNSPIAWLILPIMVLPIYLFLANKKKY